MKSLTKVILKNTRRKDIKNTKKENIFSGISFIIVFCFLASIMGVASIYVTKRLSEFNQTYAFINILLLMNFMILFAKSIFESLNVLYFSKDLKTLLRMPIKPKDILHAKLFHMIISEYEMEMIMLAIPMIVYGIDTNVSFLFYIYMVAILLILPVIPIVIMSLLISIIMRFTNILKNKNQVMYLTIIIAMISIGVFTSSFNTPIDSSISNFENMVVQANGLAETIADSFLLIKPSMNILLNYNNSDGLKNLLIYIMETILCYLGGIFIMSKVYLKGAIGTTINSNKKIKLEKEKITIKDVRKRNKYQSYVSKELRILNRTPIFLIQCVIMPILYPVFVFLILIFMVNFASKVGVDIMAEFYKRIVETSGQAIFLGIGQVFYMMNFSSIIAISKESKSSILTKYIPIELNRQFNLKTLPGVFINGITSIIVTICHFFCGKNLLHSIIFFIDLILINKIGEKVKILIDLRNPKINWENEYTMMKQNTNVMYELFYTLVEIGILSLFSFAIRNIYVYLIFIFMIGMVINIRINRYVCKKQKVLFRKIF